MAKHVPQSFENHARVIPLFHGLTFVLLIVNLFWWIYRVVAAFSWDAVVSLLLAVALLLVFYFMRTFALTVQDRIIRLEMRLRLRQVLPPALVGRIPELSVRQLIALRFASDAELPALCSKVLDDGITDQKTIKKMIRDWQADYLRA
jgi:hypothetical protein